MRDATVFAVRVRKVLMVLARALSADCIVHVCFGNTLTHMAIGDRWYAMRILMISVNRMKR